MLFSCEREEGEREGQALPPPLSLALRPVLTSRPRASIIPPKRTASLGRGCGSQLGAGTDTPLASHAGLGPHHSVRGAEHLPGTRHGVGRLPGGVSDPPHSSVRGYHPGLALRPTATDR